jgi:hypothetical protein
LRHIIVTGEISLLELGEHPISEGLLNCFEVYLKERGK